ncbi:hypothetical protein SAMN05216332_10316 [Nitrosospira briensis]|nr:hypothetical protein SAMN05216332_10316 [Nitrosospira briensis]
MPGNEGAAHQLGNSKRLHVPVARRRYRAPHIFPVPETFYGSVSVSWLEIFNVPA